MIAGPCTEVMKDTLHFVPKLRILDDDNATAISAGISPTAEVQVGSCEVILLSVLVMVSTLVIPSTY